MDIDVIKRKMLVKYPFFGSVVSNVEYRSDKNIQTSGTDGKTIYYNSKYLESLSIEEQTFVFAHEVCHIAFNHILRTEGKNQEIWNIATDAVINQFLIRDGLKMAIGGINIAEAINYDAETLYEKLLEENKQNQQQSSETSKSSQEHGKQSQDVGHDTHSMWEQAVENHKKEQESSKPNIISEKDAFKKNLEEKKRQLEELKKEIIKQATQAGTSTNEDIRKVADIGTSKPIIDWRYILKEAIKYDIDWSYENATIEDGIVTACLEKQPMSETEIILDTSGSISEILLKNFLRECKNILQHTRLKIGCFDTKFYGFKEIRTEEDIDNMNFKGYGGTDFDVAVNSFTKRVENKIIFTDGEAAMPKTPINAIWIVYGKCKIHPKGGRVIYITPEQLDRLYSYGIELKTEGKTRQLKF